MFLNECVYCFQASVLRAWAGKPENVKAGQAELLKRAKVSFGNTGQPVLKKK